MNDYGHRQFYYPGPILGTVVNLYPIVPGDPRIYVDVLPHDQRGGMIKCPVFTDATSQRQFRRGQTVLVHFIDGNPQAPVVAGHNFNSESPKSLFYNPLNADPDDPAHVNIDDHVTAHFETGFYSRVRSRHSTANTVAPDGSPAVVDVVFNGGTALQVYEYDPTGYVAPPPTSAAPPPPPPDRARATLTMPSGLTIVADEPEKGMSDVMLTHPSGMVLHIDKTGNVTITTPATLEIDAANILLNATNVQVGDKSGGRPFAFNADLVALQNAFNSHVHPGVQSGGSTTAPPQTPLMPDPTGTADTSAT